jgi:acyl-CoA synthetase
MQAWTTVHPQSELCERYRAEGWWDGHTLPALLQAALERSSSSTFRIHSTERLWRGTLSDVTTIARRLAAGLERLGVRPGDPVAFQLPNSVEAAAAFYGLSLLGAVLVPVGPSCGTRELHHALRESGARALLVWNWGERGFAFDALAEARADLPSLEHIVAVGDRPVPSGVIGFADLTAGAQLDAPAVVDPASPAVIGWTSGTTGAPKGVLLSHRALCAETQRHVSPLMGARVLPLASTSPVSHVAGMLLSVLVPPLLGQEIHLLDYWDPRRVLDLMTAESLSAGSGAPVFLASLLDHPACGPKHHALIDLAVLGGAAVPTSLVLHANSLGIAAMRGYGCTEHPTISLGAPNDSLGRRAHTDGRLCPGVEVRVVGEDGSPVPEGEPGEVLSRGPDLFSGYTDPALNSDAFDDGWFRTGDIGRVDDAGYLCIVDRKKDIIIRSGMNVSAAEVESVMVSMPQVAEVAVVAAQNPKTGEHACAFIKPIPGCDVPTLAEVRDRMAQAGLAKYKWPEEIRLQSGDFPRTAAGKVRKADLRAATRHSSATPEECGASE